MSSRVSFAIALLCWVLAGCAHQPDGSMKDVALTDDEAIIAMAIASDRGRTTSSDVFVDHASDVSTKDVIVEETYVVPAAYAPSHSVRGDEKIILEPVQPYNYKLDTGDQVRVFVYGQPNLSRIYTVDGGGYISVPLINAVSARGLSTFELERRIAAHLGREFVRDPQVSIEVSTYRPVFVLGEVRNAGQFAYANGLTARRLVALAGGFTPRADKHALKVTRTLDGFRETQDIRLDEDILPGDVVTIEERWF